MRQVGCIVALLAFATVNTALAKAKDTSSKYYGRGLCEKPGYKCVKVQRGQSWKKLFPNEKERDLVQRINRTDTYLYRGRVLAVPDHINKVNLFDVSPFPLKIKPSDEKVIIVNQDLLAWGAYTPDGQLVKWGPISSGKDYCPDIKRSCRTVTGVYRVFNKKSAKCRSNIFPIGRGGSKMPYCMFFYKGFALHGSNEVRGFRDSHGCVRLFTRDAKWLNENFVDVIKTRQDVGTKLIIQKLSTANLKTKKGAKKRTVTR